jgi:hypothetical protein
MRRAPGCRCRHEAHPDLLHSEEPVGLSYGPILMMRNRVWLLSITAAAFLVPGLAAAKDSSKLRFEREQYAPGDQAVAHAQVETWPGSGQPEDAPFNVYVVRGRPLWFGHLPTRAIPVGELRIGHRLQDNTKVGDTIGVSVAFNVPQVSNGRYQVWVCAPAKGGKGCWIGFGDLAYGGLNVAAPVPSSATGRRPIPGAPEPPDTATSTEGSLPRTGLALALVAVAAITALLVRRHSRESG